LITTYYGEDSLILGIPSEAKVQILKISEIPPPLSDIKARLLACLTDPFDSLPLSDLIKKREKSSVLIIVDDATRPNKHTKILIPLIIDYLLQEKVNKSDIKIIVACGSHTAPSQEAMENKILGTQIYNQWKDNLIIHNQSSNNVLIGTSSYGTPIEIDKNVLNAGLVIGLSDSEYHYFAGVAGTVKQLFPGCAGKDTIARNHPQMFDYKHGFKPACRLGNTSDNPVISDILEMVNLLKEKTHVFCVDAIM
jgi:nickel-dependent lactate racemase